MYISPQHSQSAPKSKLHLELVTPLFWNHPRASPPVAGQSDSEHSKEHLRNVKSFAGGLGPASFTMIPKEANPQVEDLRHCGPVLPPGVIWACLKMPSTWLLSFRLPTKKGGSPKKNTHPSPGEREVVNPRRSSVDVSRGAARPRKVARLLEPLAMTIL